MRLGMLLRLWRRRECLTLRAAAGRVGIHPSTLARVEQGEQMHGETLAQLLLWVLGREERPQIETLALEAENTAALKESGETGDIHKYSGENDIKLKSFHDVAECNATLGGEEAGQVDAETAQAPVASIEDKPEAAAEPPVHALD